MPVQPRPATAGDLAAIEALVSAAYGPYVSRIGRKPRPMLANYREAIARHQFWVCEHGQALIGLIELIPAQSHLLIENVAVQPSAQRSGVGRGLIAFAESEAQRQGFSEVRLYTNARFTENMAWYVRLGYLETHREAWEGSSVVHLSKALQA